MVPDPFIIIICSFASKSWVMVTSKHWPGGRPEVRAGFSGSWSLSRPAFLVGLVGTNRGLQGAR